MFHGSWLLQSYTSAAYVSGPIRASFLSHKSSPQSSPCLHMLKNVNKTRQIEQVNNHILCILTYYYSTCVRYTKVEHTRLKYYVEHLSSLRASPTHHLTKAFLLWNRYHRNQLNQIKLSVPDLVKHVAKNLIDRPNFLEIGLTLESWACEYAKTTPRRVL